MIRRLRDLYQYLLGNTVNIVVRGDTLIVDGGKFEREELQEVAYVFLKQVCKA